MIAAIVICMLAVVAGGLIVASKQAHNLGALGDHKLTTDGPGVKPINGRKLPRDSILAAFEEGLPSQAPPENEAPLSLTVECDADGAAVIGPAGMPEEPLVNSTNV